MEKGKIIGLIIGIMGFVAVVAGLTYAWLTWTSSTNITGNSGCFDITYTGTEITGNLQMSSAYSGGLSSSVTMKISSSCTNVSGTGTIYLNTTSFKAGTTDKLAGGALKYAVVVGDSATPITTGTVTSGDKAIYSDFALASSASTATTYKVYVWLDGATADGSYIGASYVGSIHASAVQIAS